MIYKICPAELWLAAEAAGEFAGAELDLADGYSHLSTAEQLPETAAKHFAGRTGLVLLAVEEAAVAGACAGSRRAAARCSRISMARCPSLRSAG